MSAPRRTRSPRPTRGPVVVLLAFAALLPAALAGCGLVRATASPVVDGWRVGPALDCRPDERCPELLVAVRAGFEEHVPGHPAIVGLALHREGVDVDPVTGATILATRSGGPIHVAVFTLADGTVRALAVGFPGISPDPVVFGPQPAPVP